MAEGNYRQAERIYHQGRKGFWTGFAGLAGRHIPAPPPTTAPPTPTIAAPGEAPEVLKAYEEALNRGDADAVLALFVDSGLKYVDVGYVDASDKAALRKYIEWTLGSGAKAAIEGCTLEGETWRCTLVARDNCSPAFPSVDGLHNDLTVTEKEGKIETMLVALRAEDAQLIVRDDQRLFAWVQANRAQDLPKLMSKDYSRANGELWTEACKAYIQTLE